MASPLYPLGIDIGDLLVKFALAEAISRMRPGCSSKYFFAKDGTVVLQSPVIHRMALDGEPFNDAARRHNGQMLRRRRANEGDLGFLLGSAAVAWIFCSCFFRLLNSAKLRRPSRIGVMLSAVRQAARRMEGRIGNPPFPMR